jgi:hypothetical protein
MSATVSQTWIGDAQARRMLGAGYRKMRRLVDRKMITTLAIPGLPIRYSRSDVEALVATYTRPAEAPTQEPVAVATGSR